MANAKFSKSQLMMIEDGLPKGVIIPQVQRDEAWLKNPPRPMPAFNAPNKEEGEDTKRFRAMLEAQQSSRNAESPFLSSKRAERASRPAKPSRDGMIDIATLAKEYKIIPRVARAFLRAAKYPKPAQGWAFTDQQASDVRAILAKGDTKCKSPATTQTPKKSSTPSKPTKSPSKSSPTSRTKASKSSKPKSKKATKSARSSVTTKKRIKK